jgi:hypothetical protein
MFGTGETPDERLLNRSPSVIIRHELLDSPPGMR